MSCRSADRWSAPVFLQLTKGSRGFQAGAEHMDVVMLVMNEQGAQKLLESTVNLGADASIAAGPVGRQAQTGTDATTDSDVRMRIVDMQQTLDRLLLDSSSRAVGTSGSSGATVTVDRARLVQRRRELDPLLLALDRR